MPLLLRWGDLLFRQACTHSLLLLLSPSLTRYKNLLHDCYQSYVSQRGLLLTPSVHSSLEQIHQQHSTDSTALVSPVLTHTLFSTAVRLGTYCLPLYNSQVLKQLWRLLCNVLRCGHFCR